MPYATPSDLPSSVRVRLPAHAQEIFRAAFNHALAQYEGSEGAAFCVARSDVKRSYVKVGTVWQRKPERE